MEVSEQIGYRTVIIYRWIWFVIFACLSRPRDCWAQKCFIDLYEIRIVQNVYYGCKTQQSGLDDLRIK